MTRAIAYQKSIVLYFFESRLFLFDNADPIVMITTAPNIPKEWSTE